MLGPRIGRWDSGKEPAMGSATNTIIGVFMLWWAWIAFNQVKTMMNVFFAPSGAQGVTIFVRTVQTCLELSIFIILASIQNMYFLSDPGVLREPRTLWVSVRAGHREGQRVVLSTREQGGVVSVTTRAVRVSLQGN